MRSFLSIKSFICLVVLFWLLSVDFALAVALKAQPSEFILEAPLGESLIQELIVENPDENVALYEVFPDNFSDWIKAKPASFVLEAGQSKKVAVEIQTKEKGLFSTNLSVVAKPLSDNIIKANSGIKIPLSVKVAPVERSHFAAALFTASDDSFFSPVFSFLLGVALVLLVWRICLWKKTKETIVRHNKRC